MSEYGLIKARVAVSLDYLIALSEHPEIPVRAFTPTEMKLLAETKKVSLENAGIIKDIELRGYKDIKATNHDVVAVVLYLRMILKGTSLADVVEWLHFGLTSEDNNNLAYALMLERAVYVLLDKVEVITDLLHEGAQVNAVVPMLSRTHGQPATPTTFGKECNIFVKRIENELETLNRFKLRVKLNGASGNYAAHYAAFPTVDWIQFTVDFVGKMNAQLDGTSFFFEPNLVTAQIEPHDTYAELFQTFIRINNILVDFCQDVWRYVSDEWLTQRAVEGEVGSSAMPQKVNPIDFENAEGNLLGANALFEFFARKLPISRLQRDLSDSTVERGFGTAFGLSLVAYSSIEKGLGKISVNYKKIAEALEAHPEVIAEGVQTILRREGVSGGYDILKAATRGKSVSLEELHRLIESLDIPTKAREELLALRPTNYIGLAEVLARE
jgi:adenylosuccinate lyase